MERLTDWINGEKTEVSIRHDRFRDAMIRLAAYEDTGLEPKDVTTAKSLAIQYLKETIEANEKSIQLGRKDGTDVTCICEANKDLEKVLLKLATGYQEN